MLIHDKANWHKQILTQQSKRSIMFFEAFHHASDYGIKKYRKSHLGYILRIATMFLLKS